MAFNDSFTPLFIVDRELFKFKMFVSWWNFLFADTNKKSIKRLVESNVGINDETSRKKKIVM